MRVAEQYSTQTFLLTISSKTAMCIICIVLMFLYMYRKGLEWGSVIFLLLLPSLSLNGTASGSLLWRPSLTSSPDGCGRIVLFIFYEASSFCSFIWFHVTVCFSALRCNLPDSKHLLCLVNPQCPELNPTRVRNSRSICTISEWMNDWMALIWYPIQRKIVSTRV